ncbi:hypothetical protein BG004_006414 [Podila humilis]|nr:hypothetical protein BG004_006414 [Podila humilis]
MYYDAAMTTDPLSLPEIRLHIGQFLDTRDLLSCLLVCNAWHNDFSGFLWASITFDKAIQDGLTRDTFRRHEGQIRRLILLDHGAFLEEKWAGRDCTNVTYLAIIPDLNVMSTRRRLLLMRSMEAFHLASETTTTTTTTSLSRAAAATISNTSASTSAATTQVTNINTTQQQQSGSQAAADFGNSLIDHDENEQGEQDDEDEEVEEQGDPTAIQLMKLVSQQGHLRGLSENCAAVSRTCSLDFAQRLCRYPNRLVHLHLSKWHTTVAELNMLVMNSPHLEGLRFKGLVLEMPLRATTTNIPTTTIMGTNAITGMTVGNEVGTMEDDGDGDDDDDYGANSEVVEDGLSTTPMAKAKMTASAGRSWYSQRLKFRQIKRLDFQNFHTTTIPRLELDCPEAVSIQLSGYDLRVPGVSLGEGTYINGSNNNTNSDTGGGRRGHVWTSPKAKTLLYTGQARVIVAAAADGALEPQSTLSSILESSQQLSKIVLACTLEIGTDILSRILQNHAMTLTSLHFSYSTGVNSQTTLQILRTCRNLIEFRGSEDYVVGQDLLLGLDRQLKIQQQPWACTNLERLRIRFGLSSLIFGAGFVSSSSSSSSVSLSLSLQCSSLSKEERMRQEIQALYGQLARLTRLTVLDLSGLGSVDEISRGIPFTLAAGLDHLSGLTQLRTLHVTDWESEMGPPEAEWMARHWRQLENMYNLKNGDQESWRQFLTFYKDAKQSLLLAHTDTD